MTRDTTLARIPKDINQQLKKLSFDLSSLEGKKVGIPEIFRRTYRHPEILDRLKLGAIQKRRFSNG